MWKTVHPGGVCSAIDDQLTPIKDACCVPPQASSSSSDSICSHTEPDTAGVRTAISVEACPCFSFGSARIAAGLQTSSIPSSTPSTSLEPSSTNGRQHPGWHVLPNRHLALASRMNYPIRSLFLLGATLLSFARPVAAELVRDLALLQLLPAMSTF